MKTLLVSPKPGNLAQFGGTLTLVYVSLVSVETESLWGVFPSFRRSSCASGKFVEQLHPFALTFCWKFSSTRTLLFWGGLSGVIKGTNREMFCRNQTARATVARGSALEMEIRRGRFRRSELQDAPPSQVCLQHHVHSVLHCDCCLSLTCVAHLGVCKFHQEAVKLPMLQTTSPFNDLTRTCELCVSALRSNMVFKCSKLMDLHLFDHFYLLSCFSFWLQAVGQSDMQGVLKPAAS